MYDLLAAVRENADLQVVAACEEDGPTRAAIAKEGKVQITHDSIPQMLAEVPCDVVAIGDYFQKRGGIAIRALEAGKHIISDKPLCTRLSELEKIEYLAGRGHLAVGLQLDLRSNGAYAAARDVIASGEIGQVRTLAFSGQHPLLYGIRPQWFFEDDCHGGTLNDIFIHTADAIEWLTDRRIVEVVCARCWNAKAAAAPHFQDAAQVVLRLDNDGGAIGDVSYLAPDKCGYGVGCYWRTVIHGDKGMIEIESRGKQIMVATDADAQPRLIDAKAGLGRPYFRDFLAQVAGAADVALSTGQVLRASRIALLAQQAADLQLFKASVPA